MSTNIRINPNHIYLGDAYNLIKNIPDGYVNQIYTDLPYLYNFGQPGSSGLSQRINRNAQNLTAAGISDGINYDIFNEFSRVLKKINLFIWCSKLQIPDILNWWIGFGKRTGREIFYEILVWIKNNPTPATNGVWLPDIEYCLYFRESGVKLNDGYENKHKFYYSGLNVIDKNQFNFPTCKPIEFVIKNLLHTTQPGDIVLDPFLGSGTTAAACKQIGRNYIGFEINPEFYKIAEDRLNGWNQNGEMDLLLYGGE